MNQLEIKRISGGSITTKTFLGSKLNNRSSLSREFIIVNDPTCPLQLSNVGIKTESAGDNKFQFTSVGNIIPKESISAYQIIHILYNVFGQFMERLDDTVISDFKSEWGEINREHQFWTANYDTARNYFICVSYVSYVRTANNILWGFDANNIKMELNKIQLKFDEGHNPTDKKE